MFIDLIHWQAFGLHLCHFYQAIGRRAVQQTNISYRFFCKKIAILVLDSIKNDCRNIDIDYNIGQFRSGMGLLAQGKKLFC